MEKMTMIILAVLVFGIGFMFFIGLYMGTAGLGIAFTKSWCFGYCAIKINFAFGTPFVLGPGLPGGFCGC